MRAAIIFGLGSSEKDLKPFQRGTGIDWQIGLPASSDAADAILIFGGDGTIHRHVAELVRLRLPVLIVPCGSGNDFARALGIYNLRTAFSAWQQFISAGNNTKAVDLGVITSAEQPASRHYFCTVGGVGLDADVARRANRLPRWLRGHGGYVAALPGALFGFAPLPMKIGAQESSAGRILRNQPTILAAFANGPTYGGGMKIAPHARMDDGKLDLCLIHDIGKVKLLALFPTVYFGKHLAVAGVDYLKTRGLRLETETPLDVYADGEFVCRTPIDVSIATAALSVITPSLKEGF